MTSLLRDLRRPDAYERILRCHTVEFIETHISWVFLTEKDVFKLKKPVYLGFLDFRTLADRQRACEAEVLLNRRLAPDIYIGVVPICSESDGPPRVAGEGKIIEWAVHMRRVPHEYRSDHLLSLGVLGSRHIDALARRIAQFQRTARSDGETSRFGLPEAIAENIHENATQTQDFIHKYLTVSDARRIVSWQLAFLEDHRTRFEERAKNGSVRDGHGDLQLQHIYFVSEEPIVLDCIEFNNRFRCADVCSDVAFCSMDLACQGREDLAEQLLASYARESNDFDFYAVVDFYKSYWAFVRAKVAAMLVADKKVDAVVRKIADDQARRYFQLSLSSGRHSCGEPMLVAVGGESGSGKSTTSQYLGGKLAAAIIEADRTRRFMLRIEPTQTLHENASVGAYAPIITERVYAEMLRRAGVVIDSGRPAIVDASFGSQQFRQAARTLAASRNVPFYFVECRAPLDIRRTRLEARAKGENVSDGRLGILPEFSARFEAVTELPARGHIELDTSRPIDYNLDLILSRIQPEQRESI
jgi:aminoglycoside phosphotransferase family enzyme/predicted kinase